MNQNTQQQKNLLVAIPAADGGGRNDGVGGRRRSQISLSLIFIYLFFLCVCVCVFNTERNGVIKF